MKLPVKITRYPWRTAGIVVALVLVFLSGLSAIFGPDRVAEWAEHVARFVASIEGTTP